MLYIFFFTIRSLSKEKLHLKTEPTWSTQRSYMNKDFKLKKWKEKKSISEFKEYNAMQNWNSTKVEGGGGKGGEERVGNAKKKKRTTKKKGVENQLVLKTRSWLD